MRILLTTLNARYSHLSLALRYIRGILRRFPDHETELREFTINQPSDEILSAIYHGEYDCVCFSTYIWNVEKTLRVAANLKKIAPGLKILLGGPEVSFEPETLLSLNPFIDGILLGEGEAVAHNLFRIGFRSPQFLSVPGTAWNTADGVIVNPPEPLIDCLDTIPFPYDDSDCFDNHLVYYESSRGCPYSCTYCLSSVHEGVRYFSLNRVFKDLEWLLSKGIQTIKFVDRTFNIKQEHTLPILDFIASHDNGFTCFHFEISAGILSQEFMDRCAGLRKGLVQFEIGVQSTCPEALKASGRPDWTDKIRANVATLRAPGNIHLHLDLIAGLPHEGCHRFLDSFDAVYAMKADMLQLGFLKLIHGTAMRRNAQQYGFQWREEPPYEVLSTNWISYAELSLLKRIETLLDLYSQHGRFEKTMVLLEKRYEKPSTLFTAMDEWWREHGLWERTVGQDDAWLRLYDFAIHAGVTEKHLIACLRWDAITHYKATAFGSTVLKANEPEKAIQHRLLQTRDKNDRNWTVYGDIPAKQLLKQLHFETFCWDPEQQKELTDPIIICFDTSHMPSPVVYRWTETGIVTED